MSRQNTFKINKLVIGERPQKALKNKEIAMLCGPTAVGKNQIALQLAQEFNAEIVSADSQQVYRGMDIGTAKPSQADQAAVRHHLIDVVEPGELFHAAQFARLADRAIDDILSRDKRVLVVGGTGLYLQTLLFGLCAAPPRDDALRRKLERDLDLLGAEYLHRRLQEADPASAALIHPHHRQRLLRALEVYEIAGIPLSRLIASHEQQPRYVARIAALDCGRLELFQRIDRRVDEMIVRGWLDEVRELWERSGEECRAFSAVGYRELLAQLRGELSLAEAVALIKQKTKRYAKRQMTWFRGMKGVVWFVPSEVEALASHLFGRAP